MIRLGAPIEDLKRGLQTQGQRYAKYRSTMKPAKSGPWKIEKFTVEFDLQNLRMIRDGRGCSPGEYMRLIHKGRGVVMSDTDAEIDDFLPFLHRASGRVLIAGLGMGLLVENLLQSDDIEKIVVVEIDKNIIRMTGKQLSDDRLHIVQGDFLNWTPEDNFDFGWYDIWDNICGDNAPEMRKIKRRLGQFVKRQFCWCEHETMERE